MKLPIKLSRSPSTSPPCSTPSSPSSTSVPASPSRSKRRFSLPRLGRSKSGKLDSSREISQVPSSPPPLSPSSPRTTPHPKPSAVPASSLASTSRSQRHGKAALSGSAMQEIRQVFAQFDTNGDQKISAEELRAVLASLGEETTSEEAELMVQEVDIDGDGYIDLGEFVKLNERCLRRETEEEEMAAAFAIFDLDNNGWISAEELQAVLQRLGGSLAQRTSVEDCKRMIRGVDRKGVGYVDFDDFKRMMAPLSF